MDLAIVDIGPRLELDHVVIVCVAVAVRGLVVARALNLRDDSRRHDAPVEPAQGELCRGEDQRGDPCVVSMKASTLAHAGAERLRRQEHLAAGRPERPAPCHVAIRAAGDRDVTALELSACPDLLAGHELGAEHSVVAIDPHLLVERVGHVDVLRRIDPDQLLVRELEEKRPDDDLAIDLGPRVTPRARALALRARLADGYLHGDIVVLEVANDAAQHDILSLDERVLLVAHAALRSTREHVAARAADHPDDDPEHEERDGAQDHERGDNGRNISRRVQVQVPHASMVAASLYRSVTSTCGTTARRRPSSSRRCRHTLHGRLAHRSRARSRERTTSPRRESRRSACDSVATTSTGPC